MCVHLVDVCVCAYRIKCFYPLCAITDFMFNRPKNRLTLVPYLHTRTHNSPSRSLVLRYVLFFAAQHPKGVRCCSKWRMELVAISRIYGIRFAHGKSYPTTKRAAITKNAFIYVFSFSLSLSVCISCHSRLFSMACSVSLCVCNGIYVCVGVCVLKRILL